MPSTAKSAVSDYEHLKYGFHGVCDNLYNDSTDEEFLPLKPPTSKHITNFHFSKSECDNPKETRLEQSPNVNNSNTGMKSQSPLRDVDGFGEIHNIAPAPLPTPWSPGMNIRDNPSLFMSPERQPPLAKDHLLEPKDETTVPQPAAWSPGMAVRPEPSIFRTPEKQIGSKPARVQVYSQKNNAAFQGQASGLSRFLTTKDKHSVRFDLPPMSSGDDTLDTDPESQSPITIKGSDHMKEYGISDDTELHSPLWKAYSPQKSYNPNVYSDDSTLDNSRLDTLLTDVPESIKGQRDESNQGNIMPSGYFTEKFNKLKTDMKNVKPFGETSVPWDSLESSNFGEDTALSQRTRSSFSGKKRGRKPTNLISNVKDNISKVKDKPGPEHLQDSLSSYEPSHPGALVVRESKNKLISTEYSFPFQSEDEMGVGPELEHTFARPEYNSTLKVRRELDELCEQEVDVKKGVEVELAVSEQKRTEMSEKASAYTNLESDVYRDLVDLDPSIESLCDRVVRMRTNKMSRKKIAMPVSKKSSSGAGVPDLMEFFSSDLQKESPDLGLPGFCPVTVQLLTSSHDVAFDLYRHNRVWQGLNDF